MTGIFLVAVAVTSAFFINFCAAIFQCGCVSLWNGADAHCNIHMAGLHHCPWCTHGRLLTAIPWALIITVQAVISYYPRRMHPRLRLVATLAAFPLTGVLLAAGAGLATGYWK